MRIVVTGLMGCYPFGGVFWDYVQYLLGFHRLGHDVLYVEDTGQWCYDPTSQTLVESAKTNAKRLADNLNLLDPALSERWFLRDAAGQTFGKPWPEVAAFCKSADLFLHISAACDLKDEYLSAKVVAFLDSDPMYTQVGMLGGKGDTINPDSVAWWKQRHNAFLSFGLSLGSPNCLVPDVGIDWKPTRQPIVTDLFTPYRRKASDRRRALTTIASWEPNQKRMQYNGREWGGKSDEIKRFMDLPKRVDVDLELAMSGPAPRDQLTQAGWRVIDALSVSSDPWLYRDYLANSLAEWSIAKQAYAASGSGWFSCRTACYLALGVPAVVQDTGFSQSIPTGQGLLAFTTLDEAAAAIEQVLAEPQRHSDAAIDLAERWFDSGVVLNELLEAVMS